MPEQPKVFISYSRADHAVAEGLADTLRQTLSDEGFRVWIDSHELHGGDSLVATMENALRDAKVFIALISPRYLASPWSNFELGVAAARAAQNPDVQLIPVLLPGATWSDLPPLLRDRMGIDGSSLSPPELAHSVSDAIK